MNPYGYDFSEVIAGNTTEGLRAETPESADRRTEYSCLRVHVTLSLHCFAAQSPRVAFFTSRRLAVS